MRLTVNRASTELGIDRHTLTTRLKKIGLDPRPGRTFSLREIVRAFVGDHEQEKILETRVRRELLELEKAKADRTLVPLAEAEEILNNCLFPIDQRLAALPIEAAPLCNPSDPQLARAELQRWVDRNRPKIRNGIASANGNQHHADPGSKSSGAAAPSGRRSPRAISAGRADTGSGSKTAARPSRSPKGRPRDAGSSTTG